jgi:hypothetical protein
MAQSKVSRLFQERQKERPSFLLPLLVNFSLSITASFALYRSGIDSLPGLPLAVLGYSFWYRYRRLLGANKYTANYTAAYLFPRKCTAVGEFSGGPE